MTRTASCKFCASDDVPAEMECVQMCEPCFDIDLMIRCADVRQSRRSRQVRPGRRGPVTTALTFAALEAKAWFTFYR